MRQLLWLASLIVLIGPAQLVAVAQGDAAPVSFPPSLRADLAAMVPLASDLPIEDLVFAMGQLRDIDQQAAIVAESLDMGTAQALSALEEAAWRGQLTVDYFPSSDRDPALPDVQAVASVTEYADAEGAIDGFALLEDETDASAKDLDAPEVGDRSELTRTDDRAKGSIELDYSFRTGNFVASLAFVWDAGEDDVLSAEEMAGAAAAFLDRIDAVLAAEAPNLFGRILRVNSTDTAEVLAFTEDYEYIDGAGLMTIWDDPASVASNETFWEGGGAERIYYFRTSLQSTDDASDSRGSYIVRVYSFGSERDARDFVPYAQQDFIDSRGEDEYSVVEPFDDVLDVDGGAIAGTSYVYPLTGDVAYTGYRIWFQQGTFVGSIELDSSEGVDPELIFSLIEEQAHCLDRNRPCRPVDIPEGIFG